ncbi:MAG: hypothetical protein MUF47_00570 [Porphyrobacter sp.]|jgi:hypothetical protein|nr:hypothetical protein [Porphyrobacter sp.]
MHIKAQNPQIAELNADEIDLVAGGPAIIPLIVGGAKAAMGSATGKAIFAACFAAAVTVMTAS